MNNRKGIATKLVEFLEADTEVRIENLDDALSLREGLGLDSLVRSRRHHHVHRGRSSHPVVASGVGEAAAGQVLLDLIEAKIVESAALEAKAA